MRPENVMHELPDITELQFGTIKQAHICDIIKSLQSKNSCEIVGISTKI
jgi:hypothetical protein